MNLSEALAHAYESADESEGRQYGFIKGIVTEVADPKALGRIKAKMGAQYDGESSDWLTPAWTGGYEGIPVLGDTVYVGFFDGDPNRGIYFCTTSSTSKSRAREAAILGTTFVACYNYLVNQFNTLKADFNSHTHTGVTAGAGVTGGPSSGTSAGTCNFQKAWDGSSVPFESGAKVVLSDIAMVRSSAELSAPTNSANALIPPRFIKSTSSSGE